MLSLTSMSIINQKNMLPLDLAQKKMEGLHMITLKNKNQKS